MKSGYWILCLLLVGCGFDRTIYPYSSEEENMLTAFENFPQRSQMIVVDEEEPGVRLNLCLTFVNKETGASLNDRQVSLYQTDDEGNYDATDPDDESTARLRKHATTDSLGRLFVRTILPGDYGSSSDNRHIHLQVAKAKPTAYDLHFKQYSTYMLRRFVEKSDQHFLVDLKIDSVGTLFGNMIVECRE